MYIYLLIITKKNNTKTQKESTRKQKSWLPTRDWWSRMEESDVSLSILSCVILTLGNKLIFYIFKNKRKPTKVGGVQILNWGQTRKTDVNWILMKGKKKTAPYLALLTLRWSTKNWIRVLKTYLFSEIVFSGTGKAILKLFQMHYRNEQKSKCVDVDRNQDSYVEEVHMQ